MSNCILIVGSATQAMKSIRILSSYSIPASTVKLSSNGKKGGCIYGIEFNCGYSNNIRQILSAEKIRFEEYKNDLS